MLEASTQAFALHNAVDTLLPEATFKVGIDERDSDGVLVRGDDGRAIIDVWGGIAANYNKGKLLVMKSPDPVAAFADRVAAAMQRRGARCTIEHAPRVALENAARVYTHRSAPLADLLRQTMATSNAFDTEMYVLAASAALRGGRTTLAHAVQDLNEHFHARGFTSVSAQNASGVGNLNTVSARDLAQLLQQHTTSETGRALLCSLAAPGETGTLKSRMLGTRAVGRLRAKTGTGEGAIALSGVIDGRVAFSALINDYQAGREGARAFVDAVGITLASLLQRRPPKSDTNS